MLIDNLIPKKKPEMRKNYESFLITEGKVKTELEKLAEDLRYVLEEGYSDRVIFENMIAVENEIGRVKEKLRGVV